MYCDTPAALKKRLPGAIISISSSAPRAARSAIADLEGISNVTLVGNDVHVTVDDAERRVPELKQALAAATVSVDAIGAIAPSIEDLFAALMQNNRVTA